MNQIRITKECFNCPLLVDQQKCLMETLQETAGKGISFYSRTGILSLYTKMADDCQNQDQISDIIEEIT